MPSRSILLLLAFTIGIGGDISRSGALQLSDGPIDSCISSARGHSDSTAIVEVKEPQPVSCSKTATAPAQLHIASSLFKGDTAHGHASRPKCAHTSTLRAQHI